MSARRVSTVSPPDRDQHLAKLLNQIVARCTHTTWAQVSSSVIPQRSRIGVKVACCFQRVGGHGGISGVQLRGQDGSYHSMTNVWGATWELPVSPPAPLDILIFDDAGNQARSSPAMAWYMIHPSSAHSWPVMYLFEPKP